MDRVRAIHGDSRDVLKTLEDDTFDSVVTDPPYSLVSIVKRFGANGAAPAKGNEAYMRASAGFMGQKWDTGETAHDPEFWREVYRVLKPGAHVVAFGGTRTFHRFVCAIEDAGFEVRDQIAWLFGSGFPKSHDVSKGIDRTDAVAVRRERALQFTAWMRSTGITADLINELTGSCMASHYLTDKEQPAVATEEMFSKLRPHLPSVPASIEKLVWDRTVESENFKRRQVIATAVGKDAVNGGLYRPGSGNYIEKEYDITAPFTDAARQWQGWGTALKPALEPICLARKPLVGTVAANVQQYGTGAINVDGCRVACDDKTPFPVGANSVDGCIKTGLHSKPRGDDTSRNGRWPANVIHDGSEEVVGAFPETDPSKAAFMKGGWSSENSHEGWKRPAHEAFSGSVRGVDDNGGSAARFFYTAKADSDDRIGSKHPTVKPIDLMQYLIRLVTPKGGLVLDPFAGSGSTGEAAFREGMRAILIEREPQYFADIQRRLKLMMCGPDERQRESIKASGKVQGAGPLFGEVA